MNLTEEAKSTSVYAYLKSKGFKHEGRMGHDSEGVVANYFRVPRERTDLPDCLCNDKPPQICVQEYSFRIPKQDSRHHSFQISITNEAPQGWLQFKFYGIDEADILTRFDDIVEGLFSAWKALFKGGSLMNLTEEMAGLDAHADAVTADALALQERVKALKDVLRAITDGMQTECDYGRAGTRKYCFAHAYAFSEECPYKTAERLLDKGETQ